MDNYMILNELSALTRCLMAASANVVSISDESIKNELNNSINELKQATKKMYFIMQKRNFSLNFEQYYDFLVKNPMAF